jgi:hydrogenase expression/formation protein HypE
LDRSRQYVPRVLPEGKLPATILQSLLSPIGRSKIVLVGPNIGVDVGITKNSGKYLVVSSDPITGALTKVGWHAVNASANDVATSGVRPVAICVVSLFPKGTNISQIESVIQEIHSASAKLGIAVVGGHTEIMRDLSKPIVTVTCFGTGSKFVSAADARAGDSILMTKTAGMEGTSILCSKPIPKSTISSRLRIRGRKLIEQMSIVKDATLAFATGYTHAMHDVTEGGILGSVLEMSIASKLGFELQLDSIPFDESTAAIASAYKIDPLRLIGSGSLLVACKDQDHAAIVKRLQVHGIRCTKIGRFVRSRSTRILVDQNGLPRPLYEDSIEDELWRALRKYR